MVNSKELKDMRLTFKRNPVKLYIPSAEDIPSSFRELLRSLRFFTCHVRFLNFSDKDKRTQSQMAWRMARRLSQSFFRQLYHFIVFFVKFSFFYLVSFAVSF